MDGMSRCSQKQAHLLYDAEQLHQHFHPNWWYPMVLWLPRTHQLIKEAKWKKGDRTQIHLSLVLHQLDGPSEEDFSAGRTISILLMNLLISSAQCLTCGPALELGIVQLLLRWLKDDLTITTVIHVRAKRVNKTLDNVVTWARMLFQVGKIQNYGDQKRRFQQVQPLCSGLRKSSKMLGEVVERVPD